MFGSDICWLWFVCGLFAFRSPAVFRNQTVGLIFSFCSHLEGVLVAVLACLGFPGHFDFFPYGLCLLTLLRYQFLHLSMVSLATESTGDEDEWQLFPTTQRCGVARRLPTVYNHTLHSWVRKSLIGSSGKTHTGFDHPISWSPSYSVNMQDPAETRWEKPESGEKLIKSILETKTRSKTHTPRSHK